MSRRQSFAELMAKKGWDPRREYPNVQPEPMPVYLGKGEWGPPPPPIRDSRVPDPDDDRGHGDEEDEFFTDLLNP